LALLLWLLSLHIPAWFSRNPEVVVAASSLLGWVALRALPLVVALLWVVMALLWAAQ
jgi:hypothetical protein